MEEGLVWIMSYDWSHGWLLAIGDVYDFPGDGIVMGGKSNSRFFGCCRWVINYGEEDTLMLVDDGCIIIHTYDDSVLSSSFPSILYIYAKCETIYPSLGVGIIH